MSLTLQGALLYTETGLLRQGRLVIKDGLITALDQHTDTEKTVLTLPDDHHVLPGFIDMHVHGILGYDVMDGTPASLEKLCRTLPSEGTTAFLATTMTESLTSIEQALSTLGTYTSTNGAELLGVHLEGPFISEEYAGAQASQHARSPNLALFEKWQTLSQNKIKVLTLAPELPGAIEFIRQLSKTDVVLSLGHTAADAETTRDAIAAGCRQSTHLFNAMRGMHHRSPGTVTPLLLDHRVLVEVIADNLHLDPMIIDLIYRLKGPSGIALITDAMCAKGLGDGEYQLGGQRVRVRQGCARLASGRLAGSTLSFVSAIQNMLQNTCCSLQDIVKMSAENPAKQLKVFDRKGSLAPGKDADIVVLNSAFKVVLTLCKGQVSFAAPGMYRNCETLA